MSDDLMQFEAEKAAAVAHDHDLRAVELRHREYVKRYGIITDGQARRIARVVREWPISDEYDPYLIERLADHGEICPGTLARLASVSLPAKARDPHGAMADLRALRAYVAGRGVQSARPGWDDEWDDAVVPWCYGR